eukprot:gene6284-2915_t
MLSSKLLLLVCLLAISGFVSVESSKKKDKKNKNKNQKSPPGSPPPPPPELPELGSPYNYEFTLRYDGLAPNNNGMVDPLAQTPELAVQYLKDKVMNGNRPGGTDAQVALFRLQAFDFFNTRFGIEIPANLTAYPTDSSIYVTEDSYVMPVIVGRDSGAKAPIFRNREMVKYMDNARLEDGGFYLFIGRKGLKAGGTYNKFLFPGGRIGFGAFAIEGGCPQLTYLTNICRSDYHAQGWLTLVYQTEMPQYLTMHTAWPAVPVDQKLYGSPSAAQMYPIQLTLLDSSWGTGSCHGIYYALVVNDDWFKMISNMVCTFTAKLSYEEFFPEGDV